MPVPPAALHAAAQHTAGAPGRCTVFFLSSNPNVYNKLKMNPSAIIYHLIRRYLRALFFRSSNPNVYNKHRMNPYVKSCSKLHYSISIRRYILVSKAYNSPARERGTACNGDTERAGLCSRVQHTLGSREQSHTAHADGRMACQACVCPVRATSARSCRIGWQTTRRACATGTARLYNGRRSR